MSIQTHLKKYTRPLKFIAGGLTSATVEFISFFLLHSLFELYTASVVSFLFGLVTSFAFNKYIVFKSDTHEGRFAVQAVSFGVLGLVNSQLSAGLTIALSGLLHSELVAKIITMACVAAWNYVIMGKLIFNRGDKQV